MDAFVTLVNRKCGDLGELQTCSDACVSALKTSVAAQGCCFETIMQGYEHMQPMAAQSWRRWQGLASGKCGVEFSTETCGHSVGEKPFHDLEQSVDHVQDQATENYDNFGNLIDKLLAPQYSPDPYDDYSYSDEPVRLPLTLSPPITLLASLAVPHPLTLPPLLLSSHSHAPAPLTLLLPRASSTSFPERSHVASR